MPLEGLGLGHEILQLWCHTITFGFSFIHFPFNSNLPASRFFVPPVENISLPFLVSAWTRRKGQSASIAAREGLKARPVIAWGEARSAQPQEPAPQILPTACKADPT